MRMLGVLLQGCAADSCPTFFGSPQESPTSSYFLAISTSVRPRFKRKDARLGVSLSKMDFYFSYRSRTLYPRWPAFSCSIVVIRPCGTNVVCHLTDFPLTKPRPEAQRFSVIGRWTPTASSSAGRQLPMQRD